MIGSVAVLTPWFPNSPGEWPGSFIYNSCSAVARVGWEVDVMVARRLIPPLVGKTAGVMDIGRVDASAFRPDLNVGVTHYPALPRDLLIDIWRPLRDKIVERMLQSQLLADRGRLVHVHTEGLVTAGLKIAKKYGVPLILSLHGLDTRLLEPRNSRNKQRLGELLRLVDKVVLVGEPLLDFFSTLSGEREKFVVVPNGAGRIAHRNDTSIFPENEEIRIISVSNLTEQKGVRLTIEALEALHATGVRNWRLKIIGDGPLAKTLRSYAGSSEIGRKVEFLGALPHREVFHHLARADMFVLPSYLEAFGIAYMEAMGCGALTIGVRRQGPATFINHGVNGYLVEPNSLEALIVLLRELLTMDRKILRSVALAGKRTAIEEYSWELHARRLTAVYDDVLRGAKC